MAFDTITNVLFLRLIFNMGLNNTNEQIKDLAYTLKESIARYRRGEVETTSQDFIVYDIIRNSHQYNPWFIPEHMLFALELFLYDLDYLLKKNTIGLIVDLEVLTLTEEQFIDTREADVLKDSLSKVKGNLAFLLRTNVPLEGMSELFLMASIGFNCEFKVSPELKQLFNKFLSLIKSTEFSGLKISETESKFTEIGALISMAELGETTKDYFGKYPAIQLFSKGKSFIISGDESDELIDHITGLVCIYFGRSTRNVKVLFVPEKYDITLLKSSFEQYTDQLNHNRYYNNFEYRKSAMIINHIDYTEVGPLLITEDSRQAGYTGVLCIQRYNSIHNIKNNKLAEEYPLINKEGELINIHDKRMNLSAFIDNYHELSSFFGSF